MLSQAQTEVFLLVCAQKFQTIFKIFLKTFPCVREKAKQRSEIVGILKDWAQELCKNRLNTEVKLWPVFLSLIGLDWLCYFSQQVNLFTQIWIAVTGKEHCPKASKGLL